MTRRILVVDDNQNAADSVVLLLGLLGYEARSAYSGSRALAIAEKFKPDAAFLDLAMPELDGFDLAGQLRTLPQMQGIKLFALTAFSGPKVTEAIKAAGFDSYIFKPASAEELASLLQLNIH